MVFFKDNPNYKVICFTATQIPGIEHTKIPKEIAGRLYKKPIPTYPEEKLSELIKRFKINEVVLSYSDLSFDYVMSFASKVLAAGASFRLLGPNDTMLKSKRPVAAVTAVRTGSGKSQTSRAIAKILRNHGKTVVAIRHAMPYGNLLKQTCQRFETEKDFKKYDTTIEEEEEYQPWIDNGFIVYSGFDYKKILRSAEKEAQVIIFDGGNNDTSMIKPDLLITVTDPHRAGHEISYYPGFVNFLMADVIIINKVDSAKKENIKIILNNIKKYNPKAKVILAKSELIVDKPKLIKNKLCTVVGDGPSLSHGGLPFGAGSIAVKRYNGIIVDPKKYAVGSIKETFLKYKHLRYEIPAMGYNKHQIKELEETINRIPCDIIIDGTPANLKRIIKINKPIVNVNYELDEKSIKELEKIFKEKKYI